MATNKQWAALLAGAALALSGAAAQAQDKITVWRVTFEFIRNYKFTILDNGNVWAKAMSRGVNDKLPVDKAVDEMIARIKAVAG